MKKKLYSLLVLLFAFCGLTATADSFSPTDGTKYLIVCKGNSMFATYNRSAVLNANTDSLALSAQSSPDETNSYFYIAASGDYFTIRSAADETKYVYAINTDDANSNVGIKTINAGETIGDSCLWTISEYSDGYNIIPKLGSYSWNVRGSYNNISHIGMWSWNSTDDDTWYILTSTDEYFEDVLHATLNGYYTIASASSGRAASIYNNFMLKANQAYDLTLQDTIAVGTANNYIWYVQTTLDEDNLSATLSIKNGQGSPIKVSAQNAYYSGTLYSYSTLNYGLYNSSDNSYYFTQGINASNGGYELSDGTYHLTTWAGMSSAADDRWIFTKIDDASAYCNVSVVDADGNALSDGYAIYNGEYAKNGGFFTSTPSSADDVSYGEISGYEFSSKAIENGTVTITYTKKATANITYKLVDESSNTVTDADGNAVTTTVESVIGEATAVPESMKRDYCTYTCSETTVPDEDATVTVTVTYNLPFTPSTSLTDGTATWYRLGIRPSDGKYITYDASSNLFHDYASDYLSTNPTTAELFAFTGNPYAGFQIYNCAAGIDKNLGVDNSTQIYTGLNYAVLPLTTETKWRLYSGSNASYSGAYFKVEGTETSYMHDLWTWDTYSTYGWTYKLGIWESTGATSDTGSFISFTAVDLVDVALNTIGDAGYATAYLPFNVSAVSGATAYVGAQYKDATILQMEKATGVAASNGFVLVGNADGTATLTIGDATTTSNILTGTLTTLDITDSQSSYLVFGVGSSSGAAGFYQPSTSITSIPANRAYIANSTNSAIRLDFGNGTTGIEAATLLNGNDNSNAPVYDLSGRRVSKATRGLYIQGGKKYLAR